MYLVNELIAKLMSAVSAVAMHDWIKAIRATQGSIFFRAIETLYLVKMVSLWEPAITTDLRVVFVHVE
jgi:hypothetical protein